MKKVLFLTLIFLLICSFSYALQSITTAPYIGPEPILGSMDAFKPNGESWYPRMPGVTLIPNVPIPGAPLIIRVPIGAGNTSISIVKVNLSWRYQDLDYTQAPPAYPTNWSSWEQLQMYDDGNIIAHGDDMANDGMFSCIIGADYVRPSTKIQYRFEVYDKQETTTIGPCEPVKKMGYNKGSNTAIETKIPPAASIDLTGPNAAQYWSRVIDDEDDPLTPGQEPPSDDAYDQCNGPGFTHLTYEGQSHGNTHHPRRVFVCGILINADGKYSVIDAPGLDSFAPDNNHCGDADYEDCHCVFHNMSPTDCPAPGALPQDPKSFPYPHHPRSLYPCGGSDSGNPETWTVSPCSDIYYKGCHGNSCKEWTSHAFCTDDADPDTQCTSGYTICSLLGYQPSKHKPVSLDIKSLDVAMNNDRIWIKLTGRRLPDQPLTSSADDLCELMGMACEMALDLNIGGWGLCDGRKRWFIYAWGVEITNEGGDRWLALNIPILGDIMQQYGGVITSFISLPIPYNGVLLMKSLLDLINLLSPSPISTNATQISVDTTTFAGENAIMYEIYRNLYDPGRTLTEVSQSTSDCPCCSAEGGCPARLRTETETYKQPAMWIMGANTRMRYKFYAYSMVIPVHYAVQLSLGGTPDPKKCETVGGSGGYCDCWRLYPPYTYDSQGNPSPTQWQCTEFCPYYNAADKKESKETELPIGMPQVMDETVNGRFYRRLPRTIYIPPDTAAGEKPKNITVQQVGNDFQISWEAPTLSQGDYQIPNGPLLPNIWQLKLGGTVVNTVKRWPIIEAPGYKIDFNPIDNNAAYSPTYGPIIKGGYNIYRRYKKPNTTSWSSWKWLNEDRDGNWEYKADYDWGSWKSPDNDANYFKEKSVTHNDGKIYNISAPYGDKRPHRFKRTTNDLIKYYTGTNETCDIWYKKKNVSNETIYQRYTTGYTIIGNTVTFTDPAISESLDEADKHLSGWQYQYKVASCDWPNPFRPNNPDSGANVFYRSQSAGFKDPLNTSYPGVSPDPGSYGVLDNSPPYNDPAEISFATVGVTVDGPPPENIPTGSPDVNGDGVVDMTDINIVAQAFGSDKDSPNWNSNCDMNQDGKITLIDFGIVVKAYTSQGQ